MKLLIITSIKAFEKDIKKILKSANVSSYTYKDVIGYRDASELSIQENWFANEMNEGEALFFYAFVKKENIDMVFDMVEEFNKNQESMSSVHVAVINIERSI
jgi:nitrogen regulatory protein PII